MKWTSTLLFFISTFCFGQNLIHNGSFEYNSWCPSGQGQISNATLWSKAENNTAATAHSPSPDYFHSCSTVGAYSVPSNISYQPAKEGEAYAGIFVYGNDNQSREYIQTTLMEPMIKGITYDVSFYVNLPNNVKYTCTKIGAHFSESPLTSISPILPVEPHIKNNNGLITDTTNWVLVKGEYTANGTEKYLTIGNFYSDENSEPTLINPNSTQDNTAYFYIDQVTVSKEFAFDVAPNPCTDILEIELSGTANIESANILNIIGQRIKTLNLINNYNLVDLSDLTPGIYFISIRTTFDEVETKKIVVL